MKLKKTQILDKSRDLFNKEGVANVTIRQIAKEMGMSAGNLNYHFKKRKDILEALHEELIKKENAFFDELATGNLSLAAKKKKVRELIQLMADYRFVWLDQIQVNRESSKIKKSIKQLDDKKKALLNDEAFYFYQQWIYKCAVNGKRFSQTTIKAESDQWLKLLESKG